MKTYTYDPNAPKGLKWEYAISKDSTEAWTHGAVFGHTHAGNHEERLPGSDLPREVKPLPFFWWLNPWKHMELLFDAYKDHAEVANAWRARYHLQSEETERQRQQVYDLQNEFDTVKAERDAANDAVRTLRKKGKRRG